MRLGEHDAGDEMGELVEYGLEKAKESSATKVHIARRGSGGTMLELAGRYYVIDKNSVWAGTANRCGHPGASMQE